MRKIALVIFAAALSGCVSTAERSSLKVGAPYSLSNAQIQAVRSGVQGVLKDPESARFGMIRASRDADGVVMVCGYVNARNSFGGYTGMTPFLAAMVGPRAVIGSMGGDRFENEGIRKACERVGIAI